MRARAWKTAAIVAATPLMLLVAAPPASAAPFFTSVPLMITLADASTSKATPIISVGDEVGDFFFEGVPDGIGAMPGAGGNVEVFVNHEQTTVPFGGLADFEMASV